MFAFAKYVDIPSGLVSGLNVTCLSRAPFPLTLSRPGPLLLCDLRSTATPRPPITKVQRHHPHTPYPDLLAPRRPDTLLNPSSHASLTSDTTLTRLLASRSPSGGPLIIEKSEGTTGTASTSTLSSRLHFLLLRLYHAFENHQFTYLTATTTTTFNLTNNTTTTTTTIKLTTTTTTTTAPTTTTTIRLTTTTTTTTTISLTTTTTTTISLTTIATTTTIISHHNVSPPQDHNSTPPLASSPLSHQYSPLNHHHNTTPTLPLTLISLSHYFLSPPSIPIHRPQQLLLHLLFLLSLSSSTTITTVAATERATNKSQ
ncbi:hypothetical protein E2C01_037790 [Portunus trituberculatus]|uniref:Uncharacterized protein n=1 Tax=Portunus trituberculatus TaxID=210409 RepID=A0A5B7FFI9_PORTR|nr:hypothetical protein [Portunus trituberculatus]